jgi:hypothetical protein
MSRVQLREISKERIDECKRDGKFLSRIWRHKQTFVNRLNSGYMKNKNTLWLSWNLVQCVMLLPVSIMLLTTSCESDNSSKDAFVKFSEKGIEVDESYGTIAIPVELSEELANNSIIDFEFGGTAFLDGDFSVVTSSPITIAKGELSANILIRVLDERLIENTADTIEVTLIAASGATLSNKENELVYSLVVEDNDASPSEDLQIDLSWDLGNNSVNDVNLDLYLVYDVVIEGNTITDQGEMARYSANSAGFESLQMLAQDPDREYYLVVNYSEGSSVLGYTLTINGFGYENELLQGDFDRSDAGYAVFWGPFSKTGSSLGRMALSGKKLSGSAMLIRGVEWPGSKAR